MGDHVDVVFGFLSSLWPTPLGAKPSTSKGEQIFLFLGVPFFKKYLFDFFFTFDVATSEWFALFL